MYMDYNSESEISTRKMMHEKLPLVWALYVQAIPESETITSTPYGALFDNSALNQPRYIVTHMRRGHICPETGDLEVAQVVPAQQKYGMKLAWPQRPKPVSLPKESLTRKEEKHSPSSQARETLTEENIKQRIPNKRPSPPPIAPEKSTRIIGGVLGFIDYFRARVEGEAPPKTLEPIKVGMQNTSKPSKQPTSFTDTLSSKNDPNIVDDAVLPVFTPNHELPKVKIPDPSEPLVTPPPKKSSVTSSQTPSTQKPTSSVKSEANEGIKADYDLPTDLESDIPLAPPSSNPWRWEPRLEAAFGKLHDLVQELAPGNPVSFGAILAHVNWKSRTVYEVNEALDQIAWLLNGLKEAEQDFSRLIESTDLMWRTRYITAVLKSRFLSSRFGYTATERKKHLESFIEGLSSDKGPSVGGGRSESRQFIEAYRKQADALPDSVREEVIQLINRLPPNSASEGSTSTRVLDFIFELPWTTASEDVFDLKKAREILDEKHYGMEDVKERVLELLAVNKLTGKFARGKVLALLGPPGTGKTTIAASIAASLGRTFGQISIGGLWDLSDLKGFRRTYMASMAGQLLRTIAQCKTNNPVILLDEIDKLAPGSQISTALLEILDPAQQSMYTDAWVDMPFDISNVLFVCTANWEESIHPALRDRLEVITLEGYLEPEKFEIARQHLLPKCLKNAGLKEGEDVAVSDEALRALVKHYSPMQPGVRELETQLQTIINGCSLELAKGTVTAPIEITLDTYERWLPKAEFHKFRHETLPLQPGCAHALTTLGVQQIEAVSFEAPKTSGSHASPSFRITGNLDEVMKESTQIAYTYVSNALLSPDANLKVGANQAQSSPASSFFASHSVHLHLPKGGQSKTGVHAGAAIALSLLSLALNKPVPAGWAIGGELTLLGRVLPISHMKRIVHAANLHKMTDLILPIDNKIHWDELPDLLKKDVRPHFVTWFHEIADLVFKIQLPKPATTPTAPSSPTQSATKTKTTTPKKESSEPSPKPQKEKPSPAKTKQETPEPKKKAPTTKKKDTPATKNTPAKKEKEAPAATKVRKNASKAADSL